MPRSHSPRPSQPAAPRLPLDRMVADIDAALDGTEPGALLRVTADPLQVGHLPLHHEHPLDALVGFTAPPSWLAIGVHCEGRAHWLDAGDRAPDGSADGAAGPTPVVVTALVDRTGAGAGLMRQGASTTRFDDAPEGVVGDACHRALGLPTPPPPANTVDLWLRLWLDRVVEATIFADDADRPTTWEEVAGLHPAAAVPEVWSSAGNGSAPRADPDALAESTRALAEVMPWSRLRGDPEAIPLTGPPPSREVAAWMDDGMFARVVLDDLTPLPLLAKTLVALLPWPLVHEIYETVALANGSLCLDGWSPRPEEVAQ